MKDDKRKRYKFNLLIPIILCLVTTVILIYFINQLYGSKGYFKNVAKDIATNKTAVFAQTLEEAVNAPKATIGTIAARASYIHGFDEIDAFGNEQASLYDINCLQFLKDGFAEYRYGEGVGSSTAPEVVELVSSNKSGCSKIYDDYAMGVPCIAVYFPVIGNNDIDGVIAFFAVTDTLINRSDVDEFVKFYCLAESEGPIVEKEEIDGFKTDLSHDLYTYLLELCEDKKTVDQIRVNNRMRISETYHMLIGLEEYVVSSILVDCYGTDCFVTCIYSVRELLLEEYTYYDRMYAAAVGMIGLTIITMAAYIFIRYKSNVQIIIMDEYDPVLACNTYNKFKHDASEILTQNKFSNYAIIYIDVNKFTFIKEHFDERTSEEALRYLSTIIKKTTGTNETYGHVIDDRFARLLHFTDAQELADKIRLMQALAANFGPAQNTDYTMKLAVGVYIIDREKDRETAVDVLIERAMIAQKTNKKVADKAFVVYGTDLSSDYAKEAEIEAKMDVALKNREFKVFYQPKYNIINDRIDGAEALVRWYDEKQNTYVGPDQFIPLFEVNGFIIRLDRYVFAEVCVYLNESVKRGEKVAPVSVNVSRVSATQPDFLSYYIDMKKRFSIPDDFLTMEFTESFACEDNNTIAKIVSELNKNGFRCSIDDFGSGYSSLAVLKELQMYELKLDKFFVKSGSDLQKDQTLLKMVIDLGKSFGMKVTQEGIETIEDLRQLAALGCDVIQGYYYSRPLPLSDYIAFLASDTSLKGIVNKHIDKAQANKKN